MPGPLIKHDVEFTREQMDWLDKVFPENTESTDTNTLLRQSGIRHVLQVIRGRVRVKSNLG